MTKPTRPFFAKNPPTNGDGSQATVVTIIGNLDDWDDD